MKASRISKILFSWFIIALFTPISFAQSTSPVIVDFFGNEQALQQNKQTVTTVFLDGEDELRILFTKKDENDTNSYFLKHLQSNKGGLLNTQNSEITIENPQLDILQQILVTKITPDGESMLPQVIPFQIKEHHKWQTALINVFSGLIDTKSVIFLVLIVLTGSIVIPRKKTKLQKGLAFCLITLECIGLAYFWADSSIPFLYKDGFISSLPFSTTAVQQTELSPITHHLLYLDENLELQPSLARSWSNVRPNIWEVNLREGQISSEQVVNQLKQFSNNKDINSRLLQSIDTIIQLSNQKIQVITNYPDPLLAHKLAQIPFSVDSEGQITLQSPSLQILENEETKENITQVLEVSEQQEAINQRSVDHFQEPSPQLWPQLFQADYQILPAINTQSVFLLTNRNHPLLENRNALSILQETIQTGALLQTSYFQYGQIAQQFVPPGINGYSVEIAQKTPQKQSLTLNQVVEGLNEEQTSLRFLYPDSEQRVAQTIQQLLNSAGLQVEAVSYSREQTISSLQKNVFDIALLQADFGIGDVGPFLDTLVDSNADANQYYNNQKVDSLINLARRELNQAKRSEMLQEIMHIIVEEDPIGIPLLFKRSFVAKKEKAALSLPQKMIFHFLRD